MLRSVEGGWKRKIGLVGVCNYTDSLPTHPKLHMRACAGFGFQVTIDAHARDSKTNHQNQHVLSHAIWDGSAVSQYNYTLRPVQSFFSLSLSNSLSSHSFVV